MERVATTVRIDPVIKAGLLKLSKLKHESLNGLVNEALKEFVAKRTLQLEVELEGTLADLRAYRKSDPNFERAIAEFVAAEATAEHDPVEGRIVEGVGRNEAAILRLLNE